MMRRRIMTRTKLLGALAVVCGSVLVVASQIGSPSRLSKDLRAHLEEERFRIVTSLRGLPLGVREELQRLFGSPTLDIAEPGAEFQSTTATPTLPSRRLILAGCSADHHCVVYYERGGGTRSWRVALFHWRPAETRFEGGGVAPHDLGSLEDVRQALLSGAIKDAGKVW